MDSMQEQPEAILRNPRLPTLPSIAVRVLDLTQRPDCDLSTIADVIENDQALAAKIIRTVNSSYFGLSRPCADINQAIVYLGLKAVKMLALGFSLVQWVDNQDEWHVSFDYMSYWRRAIHAASAARLIARTTGACDPEEAFLAALFQDIGMIACFHAYGDIYLQAIDLTEGDHSSLPEIERRAMKIDHTEVGSLLAQRWNLPRQLVEAIRFHHSSGSAPDEWRELCRTVELATHAAAVITSARAGQTLSRTMTCANQWFGLDQPQVDALLQRMAQTATELSCLFRIDIGKPANIESLLDQAEEAQISEQLDLIRQCEHLSSMVDASRRNAAA